MVSIVRVEIQRQMHRLASLLAANAIEAGVGARLSGAALRALRPKEYDVIKRAARIDTVHSLRRRNALLELSQSENATNGDPESQLPAPGEDGRDR